MNDVHPLSQPNMERFAYANMLNLTIFAALFLILINL